MPEIFPKIHFRSYVHSYPRIYIVSILAWQRRELQAVEVGVAECKAQAQRFACQVNGG
jgi:hypothetical protein